MMAIVAMLLRGSTDLPEPISVSSPWLDYSPVPLDGILDKFRSQDGRRLIKTHTPVDGLPAVGGTHVISVSRNPLDALRSMRRHVLNMAHPLEGDPFLAPEEEVITRGIELAFDPTNVDEVSLELLVRHMNAAKEAEDGADRSVMLVHYSDMKRHPDAVVSDVAEFIGAETGPELLDDVVRATSISSMRANAEQFAPLRKAGHFSSVAGFFAAGEQNGQAHLGEPLAARYRERLSALLWPADARWLDGGSRAAV